MRQKKIPKISECVLREKNDSDLSYFIKLLKFIIDESNITQYSYLELIFKDGTRGSFKNIIQWALNNSYNKVQAKNASNNLNKIQEQIKILAEHSKKLNEDISNIKNNTIK